MSTIGDDSASPRRRSTLKKGNVSHLSSVGNIASTTQTPTAQLSATKRKQSREILKPKTILQQPKLSLIVPIMYMGIDATPTCLNPYVYESARERQIKTEGPTVVTKPEGAQSTSGGEHSLSRSRNDSQRFQANILQQKHDEAASSFNQRTYISTFVNEDVIIDEDRTSSDFNWLTAAADTSDDEGSDAGFDVSKVPKHVSLTLTETETFFLLDFASSSVPKGTELGDLSEEDNKLYEYLTKGKGRNRKLVAVGVQTVPYLMKARDTQAQKTKYGHHQTFVSNWEMYDTYNDELQGDGRGSDGEKTDEDDDQDALGGLDAHKLKESASLDSYRTSSEDKQMFRLVRNKRFQDAVLVIERLLASNCYNEQQKRFKGLCDQDVFREDIKYTYRLDLLWTFANVYTKGRCVTDIAFSSFTEDIMAVAYGKFFFIDPNTTGIVMIWNIKNPKQSERHYDFCAPVTSLSFSTLNPNLLAIGFYNGHIKIIDISRREVMVIREDSKSSFEPVWDVLWFKQGDEESLMGCFGDGRVCRYQITETSVLKCIQIMRTARAEGTLKGIDYLKKCEGKDIAISRYAAARTLVFHPVDPSTYFIATSEGVVHRCSTNYYNQHMDLFKAHDGPIHAMKFSPFANKLFFTCGDDFRYRLWIDGINEPLMSSPAAILPITDIDWSPSHATIYASIRGMHIFIWDLQRKMYAPQFELKSLCEARNTVCKFTASGRCLVVGDIEGNVHVYSLVDMPMMAFFPENLFYRSLKKLLITRPDLIKKLEKIGSLNFDKQQFSKYFN